MKLLHTTPLIAGAAAALVLAPSAAARESCSATAQLAKHGIVTVTFTCSMHVNSTSVTLGPGLRLAGKPVFRATGQRRACTTSRTRHAACTATRPTSVGAVDVNWRPIPAVGDPILFSAAGPSGSVSLHLTVTTWDDSD
ncbi:MAG TPA: hypothetical protein VKR23_15645 [Gaiellaceae bacterium]|nr:hypothetical protein [Gaiellaceae bacterium]